MHKVFTKYVIMRAKMKISYQALVNMNTISELWIKQIISSFRFLRDSEQIQVKYNEKEEEILSQLLKGDIGCCLKLLMKENLKKLVDKDSVATGDEN